MKNLRVSGKILGMAIVVILLMAVGSGYSLYKVMDLGNKHTELAEVDLSVMEHTLGVGVNVNAQQAHYERYMRFAAIAATGAQVGDQLKENLDEYAEHEAMIAELLGELRKLSEGRMKTSSDGGQAQENATIEVINALHEHHAAFAQVTKKAFDLVRQGRLQEASGLQSQVQATVDKVDEDIKALEPLLDQLTKQATANAAATQREAIIGSLAASLIAVVVSVMLALMMGRRIARPLVEAVDTVQAIARGDFSQRVEANSRDEIGQLAEAINDTAVQLSEAVVSMARSQNIVENANINLMMADRDLKLIYINPAMQETLRKMEHLLPCKASEVIGKSIDIFHSNPSQQRKLLADPNNLPYFGELKLGSEFVDMNVAAILDKDGNYLGPMASWLIVTEQKKAKDRDLQVQSQVAGIATELTQNSSDLVSMSNTMAANAEENSSQANNVSAAAEQVSANVGSVAAAVEEMSATIQEVSKTVVKSSEVTQLAVQTSKRASKLVTELGESSNEISQVTKVIASIAQQTNILALNATIEAARAGEAGKGFAVVANEVKELAKSTSKMTEDISTRIAGIQQSTGEAVVSIEEINRIMSEVDTLSSTVASAVEEQSATTNEISRSMTEAATGVNEIVRNITGMADAAKDTSTQALRSKDGAEALGRLAAQLKEIVDLFAQSNAAANGGGNGRANATPLAGMEKVAGQQMPARLS